MRIVLLQNDKQINVRGLTKKEVRELEADKHTFFRDDLSEDATPEDRKAANQKAEKTVDTVLGMILSQGELADLDDMEFRYTKHVYSTCMKETFGAVDEEKNLSAT